jgi:RimJ/RimL family protein N-acetyltransferase
MTPIFEVRPLTLVDAPRAVALLAASPDDAPIRFRPDGLFRPDLALATYEAAVVGARPEWVWAIAAPAALAGAVSFVPPRAELEWWIGAPFRGRGLAAAALKRLLPLLAGEFGTLVAHVEAENAASRRTAARAGFRLIGPVLQDDRPMLRYERPAEAKAA